jgi:hypothetical protein
LIENIKRVNKCFIIFIIIISNHDLIRKEKLNENLDFLYYYPSSSSRQFIDLLPIHITSEVNSKYENEKTKNRALLKYMYTYINIYACAYIRT